MKKLVNRVLSKFGFILMRVVKQRDSQNTGSDNPFKEYDLPRGYEAVQLVTNFSMLPHINLFTLYEQAAYCEKNNIEGDYVECGVWKGGAVGVMAKANLDFGKQRRNLRLFDVFDNICPPDAAVDGERAIVDTMKITGFMDESKMKGQLESMDGAYDLYGGHGTIEICKDLLENKIGYPAEYVHFHKGWFQDTIPASLAEIDKIAILRLDGDWYASVKVCLENLYDKVSPGGLVIIDDYGLYEGCTKAVDEFLQGRNIKTFLSYSRVHCRYFVKQG